MVGERSYAKERNLLNAISSLKRAAGLANSTTKKDGDYHEYPGYFEIFVPDHGSAEILSNLLCQCLAEVRCQNAKQDGKKTSFDRELSYIHKLPREINPVTVDKCDSDFRVVLRLFLQEHRQVTEQIKKKTKSLIAPDKNPRVLKRPLGYDIAF